MTNITRVIKDLIEANTYAEITANVGNTEPVTIDSIVYADQTWANTSNTSVPVTGGYIKLYGKSFEPNANILFGSTVGTANVISNNEIQVSVPALATGTYTLFLYNPSGSNAIKYKSIPVQGDFNYGWFAGGKSETIIVSSIERIDFNNDTVNTNIRAALPRQSVFASSASTNDNAYIFGGANTSTLDAGSTFFNSQVIRITYANDETSALNRVGISPATQRWRATTANKNYAYTSGGLLTPAVPFGGAPGVSNTDRLDFSNDSNSLLTKGNLSIGRMKFSSISDDSYGWYLGGSANAYWVPGPSPGSSVTTTFYSIVDRLNFNSDTTTAIVRGPLVGNKSFATTTKNTDYGWISAGVSSHNFTWPVSPSSPSSSHTFTYSADIQRMTFASDNLQMVIRSSPSTTIGSAAGGNQNYGWYTAGYASIPSLTGPSYPVAAPGIDSYSPTLSNITRLTYASDTTALSNRSTFFQSRKYHTGNSGVVS
jgi:hypothetical protein